MVGQDDLLFWVAAVLLLSYVLDGYVYVVPKWVRVQLAHVWSWMHVIGKCDSDGGMAMQDSRQIQVSQVPICMSTPVFKLVHMRN